MSDSLSVVITPADAQAAAAANASGTVAIDPVLTADDLQAADTNSTRRVTIANGATIDVSDKEPAQGFVVGENDPDAYVVNSEIESMSRRADWIVEQMNLLTDPATGQPRTGYASEYNKLALQLQSLQYAAAYQNHYALNAMRERRAAHDSAHAESEGRHQDAAVQALDRAFGGPVIIR